MRQQGQGSRKEFGRIHPQKKPPLNKHTKGYDLFRSFVDFVADAALLKQIAEHEAADASADNEYFGLARRSGRIGLGARQGNCVVLSFRHGHF